MKGCYTWTHNLRWQETTRDTAGKANNNLAIKNWFHSLPFQRFHAILTLFPKSFSSFPHGTCSLSVSREYLGLDGIYHPFCAAVPSNTTLYKFSTGLHKCLTGLSPSMALHSSRLRLHAPLDHFWDHNSLTKVRDLVIDLFPFQSPLLWESLLVSFPPLNNMFKFSGCPYLRSARRERRFHFTEITELVSR